MTEKSNDYAFEGTFKWMQNKKPNKFGKYSLQFYPKDDATRKAFKATGVRQSVKEDDEGFYYTLTAPTANFRGEEMSPPYVLDTEGKEIDKLVGNGSKGTVFITVEEFESDTYGHVTRCIWKGVKVSDLIVYERPDALPTPTVQEGKTKHPAKGSDAIPF